MVPQTDEAEASAFSSLEVEGVGVTTVNVLAAASPMCSACSDCSAHGAIDSTGTVSSQQIFGARARMAEQRPEQSAE